MAKIDERTIPHAAFDGSDDVEAKFKKCGCTAYVRDEKGRPYSKAGYEKAGEPAYTCPLCGAKQ